MTRTHTARGRRAAFTLVELLVVILIIAILVALSAAGIFAVLRIGPETQARQEISNLVNAIEACKNGMNRDGGALPFLPSRIVLDESCTYTAHGGYTTVGTDDWLSVTFLKRAFGKTINLTPVGSGGPGIDWNGDGVVDPNPANAVLLEGQQALVLWLGGIPSNVGGTLGCRGFNSDPTNPGTLGKGSWKAPYYTFPGSRLRQAANGYLVYVDPFNNNSPYLYFSSYLTGNDYRTSPTTDCPSYPVTPYMNSATNFFNPNGYQIISAGKNGQWGPGGLWNGYGQAQPGSDDLANFSSTVLANPPS
jgi:prepilin-type N-terminal cleavage/methylation domain-containing protein